MVDPSAARLSSGLSGWGKGPSDRKASVIRIQKTGRPILGSRTSLRSK
jgi:hypothetical protein